MEPARFELQGAELHVSPDPTGVLVKVFLTGGLLGLSRTIVLTPVQARDLANVLTQNAGTATDMARSGWLTRSLIWFIPSEWRALARPVNCGRQALRIQFFC